MKKLLVACTIAALSGFAAFAQKAKPDNKAPSPVIFAVLNDGNLIEPIAIVENGKLAAPVDGGAESGEIEAFNSAYYRPKSTYRLIFGGADDGTVVVKGSGTGMECGANMSQITSAPKRAKLKGMVMALATNLGSSKPASGLRRMPTQAERSAIDDLVRAEFKKQNVSAAALTKLRYHNLTALDLDNDKVAELVGSYWAETDSKTRALLFLIAEKGKSGKYSLVFSEYAKIEEANVMSGEIADVDTGIYHEVLLDILDYDSDGTSEVFTYSPSFESAGFNVYRKESGKWIRAFEGSNYHCGY